MSIESSTLTGIRAFSNFARSAKLTGKESYAEVLLWL